MYPKQASSTIGLQYAFDGNQIAPGFNFHIWFPPGYNPKSDKVYPTIYGFHGKNATSTQFNGTVSTLLNDAITAAQIRSSILVMPNTGNTWGANAFDYTTPREDQIMRGLVPWVDAHTRSGGDSMRLATGFSMGCFTALRLALKYPDKFKGVCGYAGPNLDADSNNNWGSADNPDFVAIWNASVALLRPDSPCSTTGGNGIAERQKVVLQQKNYPIRLVKSAADATSLGSMNNFDSRLTALSITHTFVDLATPTHNMGEYYTTDAGNGFAFLEACL
jgi:S-formylglutathione hydrolase FrmB